MAVPTKTETILDRQLVDAVREILGLDPLYAGEKPTNYVTSTMEKSIGDGNNRTAAPHG